MAYDTFVIDENAALADIAKMKRALELLQQARQSIVRLQNSAEAMQGHTGNAIMEKVQELQTRIDMLNRQLQSSIQTVQVTVQEFQRLDSGFAGRFRK